MRRPLLIIAATVASTPLLTGAAFAATPTSKTGHSKAVAAKAAAPQSTPALTMNALATALNAGNGYAKLALDCAADRTSVLAVNDAADLNDNQYAIAVEDKFTITAASASGVSPMSINENITTKNDPSAAPYALPLTLLLQNGQWCVSGDGLPTSGYADLMRGVDRSVAQDAEARYLAANPGRSAVAFTVDATKKATKVYLGSTNLWFDVSKGTKTAVITRPATNIAPASYCIATVNVGAYHPTFVAVYDSITGYNDGPGLTC